MGAIRSACPFAAVIAAALASVAAGPAAAADDHDSCVGFIDELPVVISTQGTWCMRGNLTFMVDVADIAVQVQVPGVTIDCQGSRLVGKPTSYGLPRWAIVSYQPATTVRGCDLEDFQVPIELRGDHSVAENNHVRGARERGILLSGAGGTVRGNVIEKVVGLGGENIGWAFGISVFGSIDVIDNTVSGVHAAPGSGERAWGIFANWETTPEDSVIITGNRVRDVVGDVGAYEVSGISVAQTDYVIRGNFITVPEAQTGVHCFSGYDQSRVSDNIVIGGTFAPVWGCDESTGNVGKN